ncbi:MULTISPECIES: SDR family NAD(P)-dependent oxidoreductase [Virgibacillus]|uniref:3-oxoacyl-[acyl-carrier-protein] reductase FabG n=2 Tax=Virgibacillus TaxID=84406 RepID=A0A024QI43_9BACI|nr:MULTISPECIES: SDR family oxidoreductase [Virgibacillus]EQB34678.1 oxidoreductase [Virgibacillus sp. CM-4]MYL43664.1 SDR family oxidoreductase [Virgibacillus massiliensis]GGJ63584.1 short-chain dehydrogenase [Virgibacillus kapii]CDQ41616.1 3-oxoacyl-[acyl-carrier-protein] reductase FabG [Virgibacillus massiliensis]
MRLKGKVGIVTGSGSGIGRGIALAMAKEGANIAIVDINEEKAKSTLQEINQYTEGMLFIKDISKKEYIEEIISEVVGKFGKLDILVNNAHASKQALFKETTMELFDLSFNTGFYPTFYFMKAAYPELKKSKGKVINFASGAGISGQPTQASYAAAKEAIRGITRVAANEWGPEGINVNIIAPIALTEGVKQWRQSASELYEQMINNIPLRRLGDPEQDIGRTAVFLASDDSDYITGQTIMVDGGSIKIY